MTDKKSSSSHRLPGVGALIKDSCSFYEKNLKALCLVGLLPVLFSAVMDLISAGGHNVALSGREPFGGLFSFAFSIVVFMVSIVTPVVMIRTIKAIDDSKKLDLDASYASAFRIFWSILWVAILVGLSVFSGAVIFILPAIYLAIALTFAMYALALDGHHGIQALCTSFYYMHGNWWKVFWRLLIIGLVVGGAFLLAMAVVYAIMLLAGAPIGSAVVMRAFMYSHAHISLLISIFFSAFTWLVVFPITYRISYTLYASLKAHKPAPVPENDFKVSRNWFIGLPIFGVAVGYLYLSAIVISIFAVGFLNGYERAAYSHRGVPIGMVRRTR